MAAETVSRKEAQMVRFQELLAFDRRELPTADGRALSGPGTGDPVFTGWLAGVDEAGRGPLAGPVVAAAVILPFLKDQKDDSLSNGIRLEELSGINDSKKLSPSRREELFFKISRAAVVGVGMADEKLIDELNIYEATRLAMKKAVMSLPHTPSFLVIDGPMKLDLPVPQKGIVNGDQKSASIAAASIIAKVFRDRWMRKLHELYPRYAFDRHKGYGTVEHVAALKVYGPSPVHRRSFAPVREADIIEKVFS